LGTEPDEAIRSMNDAGRRAMMTKLPPSGRGRTPAGGVAESRAIPNEALPGERLKIGTALAEFGWRWGGIDLDIVRDPSPTDPATFQSNRSRRIPR